MSRPLRNLLLCLLLVGHAGLAQTIVALSFALCADQEAGLEKVAPSNDTYHSTLALFWLALLLDLVPLFSIALAVSYCFETPLLAEHSNCALEAA